MTTIYCRRCRREQTFHYQEAERGAIKICNGCGRRLHWFEPREEKGKCDSKRLR